ncbi:MAG: hypothetical protein ABI654_05930 [Betaproteobacteria bacterium]
MSDHPLSLFAVAMLFAAIATAADRSDSSYDRRDAGVREAQAARADAKRGRLQDESPDQLERNKFSRCEVLPADDRDYCILRMKGEGTVSGSVEGGGILRELRVTVPAK